MDIKIIAWDERYAEDFISLSIEWLEKYVSVEPADKEIIYHPYEAVLSNGGMIFFALDGDKAVGTVAMIPAKDGEIELAKLAVTESYKGQGIGGRLIEQALMYAKENKYSRVLLYTNKKLLPAIHLYKKYGFREVQLLNNKYIESDMKMELEVKDMDFLELAKARFSVRKFSDREVEQEKLDKILEAGNVAPTAVNYQPQRIYVLKSEEALAKANSVCKCIYGAKTVLLFAYDTNEDWKNPKQEGIHSGQQDVSIVATHIMLEAWNLGIASCWVNLFLNDELEKTFDLPENEKSVLLMPIGYAADDAVPVEKWHNGCKAVEETVKYL